MVNASKGKGNCFVDFQKAFDSVWHNGLSYKVLENKICANSGADLGGGCRGCAPSPSHEMTCGFPIQLVFCPPKNMWFIGVEVEQETSASPPKKNPGSAPEISSFHRRHVFKIKMCDNKLAIRELTS